MDFKFKSMYSRYYYAHHPVSYNRFYFRRRVDLINQHQHNCYLFFSLLITVFIFPYHFLFTFHLYFVYLRVVAISRRKRKTVRIPRYRKLFLKIHYAVAYHCRLCCFASSVWFASAFLAIKTCQKER